MGYSHTMMTLILSLDILAFLVMFELSSTEVQVYIPLSSNTTSTIVKTEVPPWPNKDRVTDVLEFRSNCPFFLHVTLEGIGKLSKLHLIVRSFP
jgi:hypothetical protein